MAWVHAWQGGMHGGGGHVCMTRETATAPDGTHPTEMHSCLTNEIKGKKQQLCIVGNFGNKARSDALEH